ncbi:MAG TPA: hypothetical protein VHW65_07780 [Gemmatimonadales bacterium]|jgi:hypothetical protein|nr:hypothetical protein [Gemmatimonadales bacterium]
MTINTSALGVVAATVLLAGCAHTPPKASPAPRAADRPFVLEAPVEGTTAPTLGDLAPTDVFRDPAAVRRAAGTCNGDANACVVRGLRAVHAPPKAIRVAQLLGGIFFTSIEAHGVVSTATSDDIYAANSNEQTWIVNGHPQLIFANITEEEIARAIAVNPSLTAVLAPGVDPSKFMVSGDAAQLIATRAVAGGNTLYVFRQRIVDDCHACRTVAYIEFGFEFDASGNAVRKEFLMLSGDARAPGASKTIPGR